MYNSYVDQIIYLILAAILFIFSVVSTILCVCCCSQPIPVPTQPYRQLNLPPNNNDLDLKNNPVYTHIQNLDDIKF